MKNLMQNFKIYPLFLGLFFLGFTGCSDDDDDGDIIDPGSEATISAQDQLVSQNLVIIDDVMLDEDAWLVVKKVNDDGSYSNLIADPILLEEGNHTDVMVELEYAGEDVDLESGDTVIFQLHADDGDGEFEFSGTTGEDELLVDAMGSAIHDEILITAPAFTISDQTVVDNTIVFDNITVPNNGWIVVHNSNEDGSINEADIVGYTYVPMGSNDNVAVTFNEDFIYVPGQTIYTRWYLDDPADEEFTFIEDPLTDVADFFGFGEDNTIWDSIVIE